MAVKSDIERLAREDGPYPGLDVIVHLDHAQPGADDWIIEEYGDWLSSVMWDCSKYSMKENIRMVRDFVTNNKGRFIIEGAVDEIYNYSASNEPMEVIDRITDPETAENYYQGNRCGPDCREPGNRTSQNRRHCCLSWQGGEVDQPAGRQAPGPARHLQPE